MHDLKFSFNGHNLQEVEVMWNFVAFCCRIFQFENFARTKKRVLAREPQGGALPGWYVSVHIGSVPRSFAEHRDISTNPLVVFGLLQHENKVRYESCCSSLCVIQLP